MIVRPPDQPHRREIRHRSGTDVEAMAHRSDLANHRRAMFGRHKTQRKIGHATCDADRRDAGDDLKLQIPTLRQDGTQSWQQQMGRDRIRSREANDPADRSRAPPPRAGKRATAFSTLSACLRSASASGLGFQPTECPTKSLTPIAASRASMRRPTVWMLTPSALAAPVSLPALQNSRMALERSGRRGDAATNTLPASDEERGRESS